MSLAALWGFQGWNSPTSELPEGRPSSLRASGFCGCAFASSAGGLRSIRVSLLELCPDSSPNSLALMVSDRGGARFGVCAAAGLDEEVSCGCAFEGVELPGLEFCAHTLRLHASPTIKSKLRIELF